MVTPQDVSIIDSGNEGQQRGEGGGGRGGSATRDSRCSS